jgi:REP element-mobilizing transposase RayT
MNELPKRKTIRIEDYDYSAPGAYFITVCVNNRKPILWNVGAATCRPNLSRIGSVVETAILQIPEHYPAVSVDKYCVMPDHLHMILSINTDENGRQIAAPTLQNRTYPINKPIHNTSAHAIHNNRSCYCEHLGTNTQNEAFCVCQARTHIFVFY